MKNCKCFACEQQKKYQNSIIGMYEVPIYKCVNQKEMKTKTIEVKFPTIEGMKVENASVDLKNGFSVVEYVEDAKFKKGDIVYCEYKKCGGSSWVAINSNLDNFGLGITFASFMLTSNSDDVDPKGSVQYNDGQNIELDVFRLATNSEKQLLFEALEKEGKYWDSENLEVKELSVNDKIDRILFDLRNCSESVVDASEKIRNIIDKEVNKAVNEIYKNI